MASLAQLKSKACLRGQFVQQYACIACRLCQAPLLAHERCASLEPVRIAQRRRAVLQHTTAALLAAATAPQSASANIGGADYVIGGARLSESITAGEGQVEARLPRDQAEALARAATDYGSIGEAFAAEDGAAAQQVQAYFRSGGGYDALADSIQAVTQNKEAYPKSVRKAGGAFLAATAATLGATTPATSRRRWSSTSPR